MSAMVCSPFLVLQRKYTHVTGDMQKRASEIVGGFLENIMVR